MDDKDLSALARDIADLKASVRKNDPVLTGLMSARGWGWVSLFGAVAVSLFALPAHILVARYGSFAALPAVWKAALWAALALFAVGGSIWKLLFMSRTAAQTMPGTGWGDILESIYKGPQMHTHIPAFLGMIIGSGFAVYMGHPWYALPAAAMCFTFWVNGLGIVSGIRGYHAVGWWSFITGSISLFVVEKAPFLWLFVVVGGMFFVFAGAMFLYDRQPRNDA